MYQALCFTFFKFYCAKNIKREIYSLKFFFFFFENEGALLQMQLTA